MQPIFVKNYAHALAEANRLKIRPADFIFADSKEKLMSLNLNNLSKLLFVLDEPDIIKEYEFRKELSEAWAKNLKPLKTYYRIRFWNSKDPSDKRTLLGASKEDVIKFIPGCIEQGWTEIRISKYNKKGN